MKITFQLPHGWIIICLLPHTKVAVLPRGFHGTPTISATAWCCLSATCVQYAPSAPEQVHGPIFDKAELYPSRQKSYTIYNHCFSNPRL